MFYDRFKRLCERKGVSCNKAALEIGLSNATPTKWKKTGAIPAGDTLDKIAAYFGVSTDFLLGKDSEEKPLINGDEELNEYLEVLKNRPEMRMLFQLSKDATKEDVEKAVRIIEALRRE